MKRIAIIVVMVLMTFASQASSIRYFTYSQATRTVQYLNAQNEMMIYCGYDYEIETYVLINEVWMERVNSSYYELWVYGYDAYTGDEIYMPLDLQCVWLYSAGRMYNAAQYLRFHATVQTPRFAWYIPPYQPFSRRYHALGYVRSYHYDIHRHGWMPPTPPAHGYGSHTQAPLPPYYMRQPNTPAPTPTTTWTPGVDHPQVSTTSSRGGTTGRSGASTIPTTRPSSSGTASGTSADNGGNNRAAGNGRSGSTATSDNNSNTRGTGTRSSGTATESTTNTRGTTGTTTRSTTTTPTRSSTGTSTRSANTDTPASGSGTTTSGRTGSTSTRSGSNASSTSTTNTRGTTGTRGTSSTTSNRGTSGRSTNTR